MGSSRKASSSVEPAFVWTKKLYFFIVKNKNAEKRKILIFCIQLLTNLKLKIAKIRKNIFFFCSFLEFFKLFIEIFDRKGQFLKAKQAMQLEKFLHFLPKDL